MLADTFLAPGLLSRDVRHVFRRERDGALLLVTHKTKRSVQNNYFVASIEGTLKFVSLARSSLPGS